MVKLAREDVLKLAQLSRLKLNDKEVEQFSEELSAVLAYVEQLQEVDLADVEPTYQVSGRKNAFRPDEVKSYGPKPEDLLKNVPAVHDGHIRVKRMLD